MDGTSKIAKVVEIAPDMITILSSEQTEQINKQDVLFIQYKNGSIEKYNSPKEDVIFSNDTDLPIVDKRGDNDVFLFNQTSINTLALCNADVAGFYERILPKKQCGIGVMGAYNFNTTSGFSNLFISVLSGAKKKYDLGCYVNFYPGKFQKRNVLYMGLMMKYTAFDFMRVVEEPSSVKYVPASAGQLATMVTVGGQHYLAQHFFVKTLFGLGGFNLRGVYREQYNYAINSALSGSAGSRKPSNVGFLLKLYVGLNIGFNL